MNKSTIKSLVLLFAMLLSTAASFAAGTGSSTSPYLVCGKTGFKLTSSVAIPTGGSIKWFKADGSAISGATAISQTFAAMNTDTSSAILDTVFKIVVYSDQGCPSDTGKIYVKVVPPPTLHVTADNQMFCSANSAASTIQLGASTTGTATLPSGVSFTYSWTGSTGVNAITTAAISNPTSVPPTAFGNYTYSAVVNYSGLDVNSSTANTNGCASTGSVQVHISQTPDQPASTIGTI